MIDRSMTPELEAEYRNEQARCDSVAEMFGTRAPAPLIDECITDYQRRLAKPYQQYSSRWKNTDLHRCDASILTPIVGQIFDDARRAAHDPARIAPGKLEMSEERDSAGRTIRRFYGDPMATWAPYMQPFRHVTNWGTK